MILTVLDVHRAIHAGLITVEHGAECARALTAHAPFDRALAQVLTDPAVPPATKHSLIVVLEESLLFTLGVAPHNLDIAHNIRACLAARIKRTTGKSPPRPEPLEGEALPTPRPWSGA